MLGRQLELGKIECTNDFACKWARQARIDDVIVCNWSERNFYVLTKGSQCQDVKQSACDLNICSSTLLNQQVGGIDSLCQQRAASAPGRSSAFFFCEFRAIRPTMKKTFNIFRKNFSPIWRSSLVSMTLDIHTNKYLKRNCLLSAPCHLWQATSKAFVACPFHVNLNRHCVTRPPFLSRRIDEANFDSSPPLNRCKARKWMKVFV